MRYREYKVITTYGNMPSTERRIGYSHRDILKRMFPKDSFRFVSEKRVYQNEQRKFENGGWVYYPAVRVRRWEYKTLNPKRHIEIQTIVSRPYDPSMVTGIN